MKIYVVGSSYYNGTTKNNKQMNGFFVHYVSESVNGVKAERKADSKFIDVRVLGGVAVEPGMVLNLLFNDRGYIEQVEILPNEICELIVRPAGNANANAGK